MNNKELFYFIGKCLALDDHPEISAEIADELENEDLNWHLFTEICSNQLVIPAIYLKLERHNIIKYLPNEVQSHLLEIYKLNFSRNTKILKQIQTITKLLNKHVIYPIFLKGAANLLDEVYSDTGERMMGDIDFLVEEEYYLLTAKILEDNGYSKINKIPDYKNMNDIKQAKHYPRLAHPDFEAVIEIHRIPVREKYIDWFNYELIIKEKKTVKNITNCYVPSDHHKIIHNFIHSQLSDKGYLYGTIALRDVYDLYLLSKRFPLIKTVSMIKTKRKASAYFTIAGLILGLDKTFYPYKNFSFKILLKIHSANLSSSVFFYVYRFVIYMGELLFLVYIGQIIKAIYSHQKRQYLFLRLSNKKWYGEHVKFYFGFFKKD